MNSFKYETQIDPSDENLHFSLDVVMVAEDIDFLVDRSGELRDVSFFTTIKNEKTNEVHSYADFDKESLARATDRLKDKLMYLWASGECYE